MNRTSAEAAGPTRTQGSPGLAWARHPGLLITVAAALLALVVTEPLMLKLSSGIYADITGDAAGTVYDFWYWSYALHHGLPLLNDQLLGAPFASGWDQVAFTVLQVAIFAPLSALIGAVAAYNLGMLASFPATALVTYLLGRRLGLTPLASAFAGLAFSFMPYHVEKAMGHLNQAHLEVFPAALLFLTRWWQGGSRRNLAAAGAVAGVTLWTDFYYAYIMAFCVLVFFVVSFLVPAVLGRPLVDRLFSHTAGLGIVGAVVMLFVPLAVFMAHRPTSGGYQQSLAGNISIYRRSLFDIQVYSARPWEFVLPWHSNPLVPPPVKTFELNHLHLSNFTEQSVFLGYTVVVLGVFGVVAVRWAFPALLGGALLLAGIALALPPHMSLAGLHAIGPSDLLYRVVPYFRVYSRFAVLALLGAALLAGFGFMVLEKRLRTAHRGWMLVAPFLLLAVEFNNQPPPHVLTLLPGPQEYRWLLRQPAGTLVEYPLSAGTPQTQEVQTHTYLFYQQVHEHPIFNTDVLTSQAGVMAPALEPYYKAGLAGRLRSLGIKYLLVHRDWYADDGYQRPRVVDGLTFVGSFDDADVFVVQSAS